MAEPKQPGGLPARRPADNGAAWPAFDTLFAGGAGCECQLLALTIAEGVGAAPRDPRERQPPRIAER